MNIMEHSRQSKGLRTFLEHSFLLIPIVALFAAQVLMFLTRLSGARWMWCYVIALTVAAVGVALVFYGKLPLYRQRRFFTFGSPSLPESRRSCYRWGYRCIVFAVVLLLCLLLPRP